MKELLLAAIAAMLFWMNINLIGISVYLQETKESLDSMHKNMSSISKNLDDITSIEKVRMSFPRQ